MFPIKNDKSSSFGFTVFPCPIILYLAGKMHDVIGESASFGSKMEYDLSLICIQSKILNFNNFLPIAFKNLTRSLDKSHWQLSKAESNNKVAYLQLTDDDSKF